jgi:OmpA-OmpF porin, OOP family
MRNRCLLGAGVALGVAFGCAQAHAQLMVMPSGQGSWYIGGEGGWTSLEDQTGKASLPPVGSVKEGFDSGYNVGGRLGYEWGPWRFEEEFRYQNNGVKSITDGVPPARAPATGTREAYAVMTNAIYDFNLGGPLTPHIGAGIGAVGLHDGWSVRPPGAPGFLQCDDDTEWAFGYQAIAGVRYNINPSLALDLDYRYLATTDVTYKFSGSGAVAAGIAGSTFKSGYASHSILASLTFRFRAPPAMMPPAPAMVPPPPPHQVYLVFFDWDKYNITPEGLQIIQQAAAQWRAGHNVRLEVTGYTDRSGSRGYNQRLSERRAAAVAGALEHLGVPRSEMAVMGRGENDNRVPTAPGVREPQNRRVEIVFPT